MRVVRHVAAGHDARRRVVLTLGNFDGVHLGHRAILERTRHEADRRGIDAVAFTFEPHPATVLVPARPSLRLQTLRDRLVSLREAGMDVVAVQRFTKAFSQHPAEEFVERFLVRTFSLEHVVVGHRVSFGQGRRGDAAMLRHLGSRYGFTVESIGPVGAGGEEASSTAVRAAIVAGDMERAGRLLGRPWAVRGRVGAGDGRGRTLGFPTANVHLRSGLVQPPDGVYAARARVAGSWHGAALNLGHRPTFGGVTRALEVHLLDLDADLYGAWMDVEFLARLRGEERFESPDALRAAIARDVARVRAVLGRTPRERDG